MSDDAWQDSKNLDDDEIAIDYIKSQDFKVIWADGVIGSVTPHGLVHFALFAERHAIPRRQVHKIEEVDGVKGKLGPIVPEKQLTRGSIVREMACDVFLTPQAATNLATWLLKQVEEIKQ